MTTATTDRIKKEILLRAPRERVWRALTDSEEFGEWFGMELSGAFEPGTTLSARITYTDENDPRYQFRDLTFEIAVDRIEPELLFSYRWHPGVPEPGVDYSAEPTTLVEFTLADTAEGTVLTVVESGFDSIPPQRRADAYRTNEEGWAEQMVAIERYLQQAS